MTTPAPQLFDFYRAVAMERLRLTHAHVPRKIRRRAARDAARQLVRKTRAGDVLDPLAGAGAFGPSDPPDTAGRDSAPDADRALAAGE